MCTVAMIVEGYSKCTVAMIVERYTTLAMIVEGYVYSSHDCGGVCVQ